MPRGGLAPRELAWSFMALNVGGLMLARGVDDSDLADEIIDACRKAAAFDPEAPGSGS